MKRVIFLIFFAFCLPHLLAAQSARQIRNQVASLESQYVDAAKHNKKSAIRLAWQIASLCQDRRATDYPKAIAYYRYAISLAGQIHDQHLQADAHKKFGEYNRKYKRYGEAFTEFNKAQKIYKNIKDWSDYTRTVYQIGLVHLAAKRESAAINAFKEARTYSQRYGYVDMVNASNARLAEIYRKKGNTRQANKYRRYANVTRAKAERYKDTEEEVERLDSLLALSDSLNLQISMRDSLAQVKNILNKERERQQQETQAELKDLLEQEKMTTENQNYKITLLSGGAVVLFLFMLFSFFAYRSSKRANKKLANKNREIEEQKHIIEDEKEKSESLLLNILPKATAEELKEKGYATPQSYETVSVLFTDFKGFTQVAEQLSPEEIIKELETCFLAFDEIIEKLNIEKIKTIGDAYMCAGGLPVANRTNPIDTVRAALDMQAFMKKFKREREEQGKPYFEARIGVHTGAVVAGVIGKKKFAYDIWGDTVNVASRMESSGEAGKVNISGDTYELVKNHFDCTYRGKVAAKNKGEVDMYFVEKVSWDAVKKGLFG